MPDTLVANPKGYRALEGLHRATCDQQRRHQAGRRDHTINRQHRTHRRDTTEHNVGERGGIVEQRRRLLGDMVAGE